MFGLDWRSLALLRVGLAVMVLCDLWVCSANLRAFYTDEGMLPRDWVDVPANPLQRLHLAGGGVWFEGALLALEGVLALLMLVGWRTRWVTVATWVMGQSRQARNPLVLFGADQVLRLGLFWGMFLPLGRRGSLDATAGRERSPAAPCYLGVPGFAFIVQFLLMYVFNGVTKTGPTWQVDHTAVANALALGIFSRPLGGWLNQFDGLTSWLTRIVPWLELYGPALFILPVWSGRARMLGFALFLGLQLGFNLCMVLGLFGPAMVVLMLALLPAEFWTRFAGPAWRWIGRGMRPSKRRPVPGSAPVPRRPRLVRTLWWLRDGGLLFLTGYVLAWNLDCLPGRKPLLPPGWEQIGWDLGLNQNFNMFAPDPQTDDGWYVICGTLADGRTVDAFTGASPADFSHPKSVAETYRGPRWTSILIQLMYPDAEAYLEPLALYLGNEWNRAHSGGERMVQLQIIFMSERNAPHHTREPLEQDLLWTENFP